MEIKLEGSVNTNPDSDNSGEMWLAGTLYGDIDRRDYFAGLVLQGWISNIGGFTHPSMADIDAATTSAVAMADALIAKLDQPKNET